MDANEWLLVLVDANGSALVFMEACGGLWRPMDTNGWLLVLLDGHG